MAVCRRAWELRATTTTWGSRGLLQAEDCRGLPLLRTYMPGTRYAVKFVREYTVRAGEGVAGCKKTQLAECNQIIRFLPRDGAARPWAPNMGKLASYAQVLKSLRADGEENLGDFVDGPRAQVTTWYGMLF